jgi:parvulin-like peptidyl-prolyl isomerase
MANVHPPCGIVFVMPMMRISLALVVCVSAFSAGCGERRGGNGFALRSDPVLSRRAVSPRPTVQPVDQSGAIAMNDSQPPARGGGGAADAPSGGGATESRDGISAEVEDAVRPVQEEGFQGVGPNGRAANGRGAPSTAPARGPGDAPDTTGGYQLVGTVLAEVHDAPIFADKVLATVDKALAAQAKQLDERAFRAEAAKLIELQIREYISAELEFAMALRKLEPRDRELARMATIRWSDEQIIKAGGSLEVARQRAAAAGYDFDELKEEQYRWLMRQLYYQKKEYPKIQVSAADMRRYYQENLQREFTTPDRARFRVVMIDKAKSGGRDAALGEAHRLLDRVRSGGKDFAELAAEDNDRESFKRAVDWFQRGSFVVKEVEDAAWNLQPEQVGDVIETPDAFYLVKLEAKQAGGVRPFNEPDVQKQIEATLRKQQFTALQQKVHKQLMADAIIRYHPRMIELAVEMAMQKYRFWRESASAR